MAHSTLANDGEQSLDADCIYYSPTVTGPPVRGADRQRSIWSQICRRTTGGSPDYFEVRVFGNRWVGGEEGKSMLLSGGGEQAIERVVVDAGQEGCGSGNHGRNGQLAQSVPLKDSREPLINGPAQPQFARRSFLPNLEGGT